MSVIEGGWEVFIWKSEIFYNLILFVVLATSYKLMGYYFARKYTSHKKEHAARVNARNIHVFIFMAITLFIWIGDIKTSLLSAAAVGAAIIITFRDMILSFVGLIVSNKYFQIGDYIEVDSHAGKVINRSLLNTTLLINNVKQTQEVVIPNTLFLSGKFKTLNKIPKAFFVSFPVSVKEMSSVYRYGLVLEDIALRAVSRDNINYDSYISHLNEIEPYFDPKESAVSIGYALGDPRQLQVIVQLICRPSQSSDIKDQILSEFLQYVEKEEAQVLPQEAVVPKQKPDSE